MRYLVALIVIGALLALPVGLMMGATWWHLVLLTVALIIGAAVLDIQADKAAAER